MKPSKPRFYWGFSLSAEEVRLVAWNPLGSVTVAGGAVTFVDDQADGYPYRFYRVRSDSILSFNALGFVAIPVPTGYSMIANPLVSPTGNTIAALLPSVTEGTMLYKWNEITGSWSINTFDFGAWDLPNMTLNPGEGVTARAVAPMTFTFVGELRQGALANAFPSGMSVRSSIVPQSGPLAALLGFPPLNDQIERYNNPPGSYSIYSYDSVFEWDPSEPEPRVGESFWINTSTGRTWSRQFTIW